MQLQWRADSRPGLTAAIADEEASGALFAVVMRDDVLRLSADAVTAGASLAPNLIARSGTLADDPAERDPRTWGPAGLAALRESLARLREPFIHSGARLLIRPHARHVLCDPQRCVSLLNEWEKSGDPFGIALDPGAMLEESMLANAADHLRRACEAIGARAAILIVAPSLGISAEAIASLAAESVPESTPRVRLANS